VPSSSSCYPASGPLGRSASDEFSETRTDENEQKQYETSIDAMPAMAGKTMHSAESNISQLHGEAQYLDASSARRCPCNEATVGSEKDDDVGLVYPVLETRNSSATVRLALYVGSPPAPHEDHPCTPPRAQALVSIEDVYSMLQTQIQDPERGWGVLMRDVRNVLTAKRFKENAGSRAVAEGCTTWPIFIRTVLHMLHR
jgi:hypothetical protein